MSELDELVERLVVAGLPAGRAMPDVLEVGCGDGAFAERFTTAHPQVAYLATDASPRAVEATRARGVPAQLVDVCTLLAGAASYDVVVAVRVLDHVADLDVALAELRRVLRPGGRLVTVTGTRTTQEALHRRFEPEDPEGLRRTTGSGFIASWR